MSLYSATLYLACSMPILSLANFNSKKQRLKRILLQISFNAIITLYDKKMTKNVTFHNLFSNLVSIKHDFYRRGVKLSETNHIKNMNVFMTIHRKIKRFIPEIALYRAIYYISLLSMCQKRS